MRVRLCPTHDESSGTHRRVALLGLAGLLGEHDQPVLVLLQAGDVDLLALLGPGLAAVVDDDAETLGLLPLDASLLDLRKRKAAAEADLGVVAESRASDSRTQQLDGAHTERQGLGLAGDAAAVLAAGLVEPGLDPLLFGCKMIL